MGTVSCVAVRAMNMLVAAGALGSAPGAQRGDSACSTPCPQEDRGPTELVIE